MLPDTRIGRPLTDPKYLAKIDLELGVAQKWLANIVNANHLDGDSALAEAVLAIAHARGLLQGSPQLKPRRVVVWVDDESEN